jgi:hypothetical protein
MRISKDMTITLTLTLTPKEVNDITENSMERVMNTAIEVGGWAESAARNPEVNSRMSELGSTSWQDCEDLKWTVNKLWNQTRDAIFKASLEEGK